jgi:tetratricopeptide (TPR) repeat protein
MSDDYDYMPEDDIIDYDPDQYMMNNIDEGGINLEDMFISAESASDPLSEYFQIIELENDNSSGCRWSYKSYEKLCLIFLKNNNIESFKDKFDKLIELYTRVDEYERNDTIRNIIFTLNDEIDKDIVIDVLRFMIEKLKEKDVVRAAMDTGLQFARSLFNLGRNDELGDLLQELLDYMDSKNLNDEIYKSIRLELLVMKIQFCNLIKNSKESKRLYLEAYKLNQDQIINDSRLSAIINEEGGKMHMRGREYDLALEKFKSAFHNYEQSGSSRAVTLLKYAILSMIITRNKKNIISPDEAKPYLYDPKLNSMIDLLSAYEEMDIGKINYIWNDKISKYEDDSFILENLNEILHNIRFNYICNKLKACKICKFVSLENVR